MAQRAAAFELGHRHSNPGIRRQRYLEQLPDTGWASSPNGEMVRW